MDMASNPYQPSSRQVDDAESGPVPHVTTSTNRQNLYRALHDFIGQSQNELSLRNGDVLDVIKRTNNGNLRSFYSSSIVYCSNSILLTLEPGWWYCQKKDGSAKGYIPGTYLTKVTSQPSYSQVASATQGLLRSGDRTVVLADGTQKAAPTAPRTNAKENLNRRGIAKTNVRGDRNHLGGNSSTQHAFKGSSMTSNASAPEGDYHRNDSGNRLREISHEDQCTYPNFHSSFDFIISPASRLPL